jgi:hypothetical protein
MRFYPPVHPDSIIWMGLTGSDKELYLTNRQAMRLMFNSGQTEFGRESFEVGGARIVETYQEALRRGWYDVAELFADDEAEPDEPIQ